MKTGNALAPWRFGPINADAIRTLADILNDPNPIHLDPYAVRAAGLGDRVINQGPANLAYILNMLESNGLEIKTLEASFTGNVRAADIVEAQGDAGNVGRDEVHCTFSLTLEGGAKAIVGAAICTPATDQSS